MPTFRTPYLLFVFCIALVLLGASCAEKGQDTGQDPEETVEEDEAAGGTVSMDINFGGNPPNKRITGIPWQSGMTVLDAMNEAQNAGELTYTSQTDSSLGVYITGIDGVMQTQTTYWLFCVNNVTSQVGVSEKVLNDGDNVEWYYTSEWPPCPMAETEGAAMQSAGRGQHPAFPLQQ